MVYESRRLYRKDVWVQALYERAFPENERRDLEYLMQEGQDIGILRLVLRDGQKVGFYCILRCLGICHIIYFAVDETLRGQGIGSEILRQIGREYPGERIIVDVERESPTVENNRQRIARKKFYARNGFEETDIKYRWKEEDYEILSSGGNVTPGEWDAFWTYIRQQEEKLLY